MNVGYSRNVIAIMRRIVESVRGEYMDRALIERAIESAKARIYKLEKDQEGRITGGHFMKIENQKEVMEVTVEALERMLPKKIIYSKQSYSTPWLCPECEAEQIKVEFMREDGYEPQEKLTYCWKCGTCLDWR